MGQIFAAPKTLEIPSFSNCMVDGRFNRAKYQEATDKYLVEAKAHINSLGYNEPETGKEIQFPVADGYARYMVIGLKKGVKLMHLPLDDAWNYEYAHRLTAKDVKEKIANQEKLANLFGGKK